MIKMMKSTSSRILLLAIVMVLSGCSLLGGGQGADATEEAAQVAAGPTATATPLALAPTLAVGTPTDMPTVEGGDGETTGGPTPLPEPTQIGAPTATPEDGNGNGDGTDSGDTPAVNTGNSGPGISISPQLGEPLDVIVVHGSGFEPNEKITFHWGAPDGSTGPEYYSMATDENGNFEIGLKVLPADRWPHSPPKERDLLQLRVFSESLGENYYWANFTYVPRVNAVTSLVQTYENADFGYSISLPNQWTWSWVEDDTSDVRFDSPGAGNGFIRVEAGTSTSSLIPSMMSQEFSGQSYTTRSISSGKYPGSEAVLNSGRVVQFIPSGGQTYILSFVNDSGAYDTNIHGSLTLK